MSEEQRFVGREEKNVLYAAVGHFGGVFGLIPKKLLTNDPAEVLYLADLLGRALAARIEVEEDKARANRKELRAKNILVRDWQIFAAAEDARRDLREYRSRLEAARKADAEWRAANPPKPREESAAG